MVLSPHIDQQELGQSSYWPVLYLEPYGKGCSCLLRWWALTDKETWLPATISATLRVEDPVWDWADLDPGDREIPGNIKHLKPIAALASSMDFWGFPGGSVVKNLPANAGDVLSVPGWGRSPWGGNGNPLQYSCLGNPMAKGARQATVYGVAKSSDMT